MYHSWMMSLLILLSFVWHTLQATLGLISICVVHTQYYSYILILYWSVLEWRTTSCFADGRFPSPNSLRQTGDHPFTANSMHFRWGPWSFSFKKHWTLTSTKALDGGLNSAIMLHNPGSTWLNLTWLVLLVLTQGHFLWSDAGFTRKLELRQCQVQHQRWHCTGRLNFMGLPVSLSAEVWPNHLDISRWIKSPILAKHFNPDSPSESSESMPKISKEFQRVCSKSVKSTTRSAILWPPGVQNPSSSSSWGEIGRAPHWKCLEAGRKVWGLTLKVGHP